MNRFPAHQVRSGQFLRRQALLSFAEIGNEQVLMAVVFAFLYGHTVRKRGVCQSLHPAFPKNGGVKVVVKRFPGAGGYIIRLPAAVTVASERRPA